MTMVFATIFFTVISGGALASLALSLDEAREAFGNDGLRLDTAEPRRRIRVSRPIRLQPRSQPQRAAA